MTDAPLVHDQRFELVPVDALEPWPGNPRLGDVDSLRESIDDNGFYGVCVVQASSNRIIAGNHRWRGAKAAGATHVPVAWLEVDDDRAARINLRDNREADKGTYDDGLLADALAVLAQTPAGLAGTGWSLDDLDEILNAASSAPEGPVDRPTLADRFLIPPFDVLDARRGWWRSRKRQWLALGIQSELGRGDDLLDFERASVGVRAMLQGGKRNLTWNTGGGKDPVSRLIEAGEGARGRAFKDMNAAKGRRQEKEHRGLLGISRSGRQPDYYTRKNALEAKLGRELSNEEYEALEPMPEGGGGLTAKGTSVFDPVLCELVYRWFCPPGGTILDPFAGGSVRGVVAALLGRAYRGNDLAEAQVAANRLQAQQIVPAGDVSATILEAGTTSDPAELTPVQEHAGIRVKRDDLLNVAGATGGKARACLALAAKNPGKDLVTCGARQSPQAARVAALAAHLRVGCRVHVPEGADTQETAMAAAAGAEVIRHPAGRLSVLKARAKADAAQPGRVLIPWGLECREAVEETSAQTANLPYGDFQRLVVPVGSGMSLAGILTGLARDGSNVPVLGVRVGAEVEARLDKWAPAGWRDRVTLVGPDTPYEDPAPVTTLGELDLDAHYEAKCLPWLEAGDLLWVVGIREQPATAAGPLPEWTVGDSREWVDTLEPDTADLVFTCPPYYNLEEYKGGPGDLSSMGTDEFHEALEAILKGCARALRDDRFAVVVTGDAREGGNKGTGALRDLRGATVRAAAAAGLSFHAGAVLVTPVGSLPIRLTGQFTGGRTLGRTHQDVLVFCKGSRKKAAEACGVVDVADIEQMAAAFDGVDPDPAGQDLEEVNGG